MKELSPLNCIRCGEKWTPKVENPRYCPRCKSPFWNTPYRRGPKKTVEERVTGTPAAILNDPPKSLRSKWGFAVNDVDPLIEYGSFTKDANGNVLSYEEQVKLAIERMRK